MTILDKIIRKPGIAMDKIIDEYTADERDNIYPSLGQKIVAILVGELELMDYIDVEDNKATSTDKGKKKLEEFKASLTAEELKALGLE